VRNDVPRKLSWKEQREYDALEAEIAQLEERKAQRVEEMNRCGDDYVRLQSLAGEVEQVNLRLENALARWFELAEIAEQA
jgi:ATP-binding cassette subfamily F protein uup